MSPDRPRRIIILGATGSIGTQTVEVVQHLNALNRSSNTSSPAYQIVALSAGRNAAALYQIAENLAVNDLAIAEGEFTTTLPSGTRLRTGPDAAEQLVREVEADIVVSAIVGSAGLGPTLAAIEQGTDIALANKETLVAAGEFVTKAASKSGSRLLPVDSEHSAIWQCLAARSANASSPSSDDSSDWSAGAESGWIGAAGWAGCEPPCDTGPDVARVILTASGGALREKSRDQVYNATVEDALAHPTWDMGAKVTIDSASLTNKALELVEAHWLFGLPADKLDALIHPSSIVHSFVEFADGSVIAQLGAPDMRTPIQCALTWPDRAPGVSNKLPWAELRNLAFEPVDDERFPALCLGLRVIEQGGTAGAVFNAANERAVQAFLDRKIPFGRIAELTRSAMDSLGVSPVRSLQDALDADAEARKHVESALA